MSNEIIQDYGKTITPEEYNAILKGHQYISQADYCIESISKKFCGEKPLTYRSTILDLGCGPGRITMNLGLPNSYVMGVDIAPDFIKYALNQLYRKGSPPFINYQYLDFTSDEPIVMGRKSIEPVFDVIVMQGVMHHVHGDDRAKFIQKCHKIMKPDGILIIGDEFIRDYRDEDDRKQHVCAFYAHIIAEALKGGFRTLAEEEAKNLIDDVLTGEEGAGHMNEELKAHIFGKAQNINKTFYTGHRVFMKDSTLKLIDHIRRETSKIVTQNQSENFNRGDLKISTEKFISELESFDFKMKETFRFGPVEELGGMAVIVFTK